MRATSSTELPATFPIDGHTSLAVTQAEWAAGYEKYQHALEAASEAATRHLAALKAANEETRQLPLPELMKGIGAVRNVDSLSAIKDHLERWSWGPGRFASKEERIAATIEELGHYREAVSCIQRRHNVDELERAVDETFNAEDEAFDALIKMPPPTSAALADKITVLQRHYHDCELPDGLLDMIARDAREVATPLAKAELAA